MTQVPAKPINGYMVFINEIAVKNKPLDKDNKINAKDAWNNLSTEEQDVYRVGYKKRREEYDVAIEKYKTEHPDEYAEHVEARKTEAKLKKKRKLERLEKQESKKSRTKKSNPMSKFSCFILFSHAKRAELKNSDEEIESKDIMKRLGEMWRNTDEEEKEKWRLKSNKMYAEYLEENKSNCLDDTEHSS